MPFEFDNAINAVPLGEGLYDTPVEDRWDINGNANGGYLLALAASAMRAESGRAHPVSISMHYLSPAPAGPAQMRTEVVKAGRRLATVVGTMTRDGKDIVRSIGTFGDIDATAGPQSNMILFPDLPPLNVECVHQILIFRQGLVHVSTCAFTPMTQALPQETPKGKHMCVDGLHSKMDDQWTQWVCFLQPMHSHR